MQKLRFFVSLSILGIGAGTFWLWQQATYIPEWYTQPVVLPEVATVLSGTDVAPVDKRQALKSQLARQVIPRPTNNSKSPSTRPDSDQSSPGSQTTHEVTLDSNKFGQFVISSIPQTTQSEQLLPAIKAINTEIDAGQLKIGIVVNTAEIPLEELTEEMQSQFQKTLSTFPFLKDKEIYLALSGQPSLESGEVILGKNAKVQIGGLTMDLSDASAKMGIPFESFERQIYLQLGQLNIQDISLIEKEAVLRGTVN